MEPSRGLTQFAWCNLLQFELSADQSHTQGVACSGVGPAHGRPAVAEESSLQIEH